MRLTTIKIMILCFVLLFVIACPYEPETINNDVENTDDVDTVPGGDEPKPINKFYVYHDFGYRWNNFYSSGWMGDLDAIEFNGKYSENESDPDTCQMWTYRYSDRKEGWCGVVWQNPENNWDGDIPDAGYNLNNALFLAFKARGDKGGEVITFGFGGLEGDDVDYPDSVSVQKKKVVLDADWNEFKIVIDHLDLSSIHNGFMWTIDSAENEPEDITFYLDEIRYEYQKGEETDEYKFSGMCFSPYTEYNDPTEEDTVTVEQVENHLSVIVPYTNWIRTYGMEGGLSEAGEIAHRHGLKIAMCAWISRDLDRNTREFSALVDKALAGHVDVAIVGNEVLDRRDLEVEELIAMIEEFRRQVPNVPVTTAEVYNHWIEYPSLIDACDQIYIHSYPFWDEVAIEDALKNLNIQYDTVLKISGGKPVIVSETGWPSSGDHVGNAVPNEENAAYYFLNVASWAASRGISVFYFEAFDEPFKAAQEPNGVGAHWGLFNVDKTLKNRMDFIFLGYTTFDDWIRDLPCGEGAPEIEFTDIPAYGSYDNLKGRVCHVWPENYAIAVYIYVSGWWTKPYFDRPLTLIQADGSFVTDITTGGSDQNATSIAAFLVPSDYIPPTAGGGSLPSTIINDAIAQLIVNR